MIRSYADRPDAEDPVQRERVARERLPELQRLLLAALPVTQRPMARLVLTFAERLLPLRGVGKRAFLQSLDVARGAARRLGEHLVAEGRLISAGDVFQLTVDELTDVLPADAADLAQLRRERGREYEAIRLPGNWRGRPDPTAIAADPRRAGGSMTGAIEVISGLGVSAGVVEGRVRVVVDPSFAEVEPGEVLVTSTTDPSWASIMFLSSALIVDIGGPLSHAAVVARELGVPCVVNTRTASSVLHTGDLVRVDGNTGSVEVLDRVENNQSGHVVQESSSREVKP
jgi:pyruvate,water dikinase